MRLMYLFLKIVMSYSLRIFFRKHKVINNPKKMLDGTIYATNHPSSFLDPLAFGEFSRPSVFFMTRSDVFIKPLKPLLSSCQMLPIYRQLDGGEEALKKNKAVFDECARLLKRKRNLLLFAEGFTDDVFIRRLKKVRKGAIRIGFESLEENNWEKEIKICAVGLNYTEPSKMRSDVLISFSDSILLNDYKKDYLENKNRTITSLTRTIEKMMQEQITHNQRADLAPFHEQIMMITRKGMNNECFDNNLSLEERWIYSKQLAKWLNNNKRDQEILNQVKSESDEYFSLLKKNNIEENLIHWKHFEKSSKNKHLFKALLLLPFAIIGFIHCAIPYFLTRKIVKKIMKRPVFWSSVKIVLGMPLIAVFNAWVIPVFYHYIYPNWGLAILYFLSIGLTGFATYMFFYHLKMYKKKSEIQNKDTQQLIEKRNQLSKRLEDFLADFNY